MTSEDPTQVLGIAKHMLYQMSQFPSSPAPLIPYSCASQLPSSLAPALSSLVLCSPSSPHLPCSPAPLLLISPVPWLLCYPVSQLSFFPFPGFIIFLLKGSESLQGPGFSHGILVVPFSMVHHSETKPPKRLVR